MKKLIYLPVSWVLPIFLVFFSFFLPTVLFAQEVSQGKKITCEEASKILNSADCPFWAAEKTSAWCYQEEYKGGTLDELRAYMRSIRSRTPDYILEKNFDLCDWPQKDQETDNKESGQQDTEQPAEQTKLSKGPSLLSIGYKWLESLYFSKLANLIKDFEVIGVEAQKSPEFKERELLERKADLSDETVNQLRQNTQDSPYRLDILEGEIQIKLPGQNEWSDLKQGDKIPAGSTIFTGMDTTTVLSIKDKGVVQVQSFTEITISEKGLEEAAKTGQTYTDIKLEKGEIEVNIDPYVPTTPSDKPGSQGWGMSIYGPFYSAAVRGTHFWVSQEEGKQEATIGVYKGQVEVQANGNSKSTLISPRGDKPGVVVVTQKFSPVKVALAGLIMVTVLGGIVWLIKKKTSLKSSKKR